MPLKPLLAAAAAVLTFLATGAAAQSQQRICVAMDEITQRLNMMRSDEPVVQMVRGIYTNRDLAFGGTPTRAKCLAALADLRMLEERLLGRAGLRPAEACVEVDLLLSDTVRALEDLGTLESGGIERILAGAGMQVADLNPNGSSTQSTCAAAREPLSAYLAAARAGFPEDQPEEYDLPASYGVEGLRNVNPGGQWRIAMGGDTLTLWDHNGSQMAWEGSADGTRAVWYWNPRPGLADVGVSRGTLLFEGRRDGPSLSGTARIFTPGCGVWLYPVSGPIDADNAGVTLTGLRPLIGADCDVRGTATDTLIFDYIADAPPGETYQSTAVEEDEYDTPGIGVWGPAYEVRDVPSDDTLNVRSGPSTSANVLFELPPDATEIIVIGNGCTPQVDTFAFEKASQRERLRMLSNVWCNIDWYGREGWAFGRYLAPMMR